MSKKTKTREELIEELYLRKSEIKILLNVSNYEVVKKIYSVAREKDISELGERVFHRDKVRRDSALWAYGVTFEQLHQQIKKR